MVRRQHQASVASAKRSAHHYTLVFKETLPEAPSATTSSREERADDSPEEVEEAKPATPLRRLKQKTTPPFSRGKPLKHLDRCPRSDYDCCWVFPEYQSALLCSLHFYLE